jgi:precorrin-2 dehydrogenase/sirohydrochlorin ferrochelatase
VRYYPIFLDLAGKRVLVAGAGKVALRKTKGLVEAGARVTVVAPRAEPEFAQLPVILRRRRFRATDLRGAVLAFTATDDRRVNQAVAVAAKRLGIPVNVADSRPESDFIVPSRITRGNLQVAVSTGGESPRLAAALRRKIEESL